MNFGLDMFWLGTNDFRLQTLKGWGTRSGNIVGADVEPFGQTRDGFVMHGAGYFKNRTSKKNVEHKCSWDVTRHGIFIQLNPSTLLHGWQLTTDLEPALNAIRHDMNLLGVELDVDQLSVNRADITKQAAMNAPASSFHSTFGALNGSRMKKTQYPDGFTFGNTQKEVVFYDKTLQLAKVKGIFDAPPNLLRCEARWKKRKVIGHDVNGLGAGKFADMYALTSSDLDSRFKGMLNASIFKPKEGQQLALNFNDEVEVLRSYIDERARNGWMHYVLARGAESVLNDFGSWELFGLALEHAGLSSKQSGRAVTRLREQMMKQSFIDSRQKKNTTAANIEQLRQTFAA